MTPITLPSNPHMHTAVVNTLDADGAIMIHGSDGGDKATFDMGGSTFDVISFDLAGTTLPVGSNVFTASSGATLTVTTPGTVVLPAGWTGITSFTWAIAIGSAAQGVMDNLVIEVVHETLTNGSFENGTINGTFFDTLAVGDTSIDHWSVIAGTVDYNTSNLWEASDGDRSLDMDGFQLPGTVGQTIATVPGNTYKVKFDMAGNPGGPPVVKELQACAGATCQTFTFTLPDGISFVPGQSLGWVEKSYLFVATDANTTLTFKSLTTPGSNCVGTTCSSWGPTLDNVQVSVHKVLVCHKGKKTLNISENAVKAHLKHGDALGSC